MFREPDPATYAANTRDPMLLQTADGELHIYYVTTYGDFRRTLVSGGGMGGGGVWHGAGAGGEGGGREGR